jgi:hypothetical protein
MMKGLDSLILYVVARFASLTIKARNYAVDVFFEYPTNVGVADFRKPRGTTQLPVTPFLNAPVSYQSVVFVMTATTSYSSGFLNPNKAINSIRALPQRSRHCTVRTGIPEQNDHLCKSGWCGEGVEVNYSAWLSS